jgi:peptide subunit release factor 1 (eRF1)
VVEALAAGLEEWPARWIVLAGESETVAAVRDRLPPALRATVAGTVRAAWHEPAAAIAARADETVRRVEAESARQAIAQAVTDAAKGQRAVSGVDDTLAAAARAAVRRLFVLRSFAETGRACTACGALSRGEGPACPVCHGRTRPVELGDAAVARVLASGGTVVVVADDTQLASAGGMAALLRFPL